MQYVRIATYQIQTQNKQVSAYHLPLACWLSYCVGVNVSTGALDRDGPVSAGQYA